MSASGLLVQFIKQFRAFSSQPMAIRPPTAAQLKGRILNPEFTPVAHTQSATYIRQQQRIEKIARMQAESVEVKTAAENAAAAAKMEKEMPKVLTSKRTGKPLYTPQPLRSSACIYKEARMNSVSYESLAKTNASMDTMASSSSAFTSSGNANVLPSGNTLATLLLSVLAMGGFVEGFVLFSKTSSSPSSTSVLTYSQGVDTGLKNVKSLHETGYRPSTIKLIKKALDEQSRRQNAGM